MGGLTEVPTYVELFAGAGGLSLGLDRAGWRCAGHAEIEPHARAILRYRWPDTPLYGDVSTLDGTAWKGVTMISGGSPCQDLSIAGKREGLTGRRSGLFFHQVRLWRESEAPLLLWENVVGALSSNQGKDFSRILSTILGEPVAVPRDGQRRRAKWATAGYVSGTRGIALAWRVLDLRRFNVPQRRRRVFIVAVRGGVISPRDVLFDAESVRGDSDAGGAARQVNPGAAVVGAGAGGVLDTRASEPLTFKVREGCEGGGKGYLGAEGERFTLGTSPGQYVFDARGNGDGQTCNTLAGDHQNRVTDYTARVVCDRQRSDEWHPHADAVSTISARDYKSVSDIVLQPRPRRLMPVECERLMSWPDDWTAIGIDEQGREYRLRDTPRYKCCGNGVASVVAEWIGRRILLALEEAHAARP
jgi:DNA (cytosine-5)-methyltransferase 1